MKSYIACIQKLKEITEETNTNNQEKFIACPSLRLFESEDFKFLSGENLSPQDFLKSEDISLQLNSLSNHENYWDIDPNLNLFDTYKNKIERLKVKTRVILKKSCDDDIKLLYLPDETETDLMASYNEKLLGYDELIQEYQEIVDEYDDSLSDLEKKSIEQRIDIVVKTIALHTAKWELNSVKSTVESTLEKINRLNHYDLYLNSLNEIKSKLKNSESTGIQSNDSYNKLHIVPYDFYENDNNWNSIEIQSKEFDSLFNKAKKTLEGFNESILEFDYKEDFIEKITFNYCSISIKRNWFQPAILHNEFVENKIAKNQYTYAKKVMLMKDLRIILKENLSSTEKKEIEKNSVIKFGPIFMKNQFFRNKISNEAFVKPITSKSLIKKRIFKKMEIKIDKASPSLATTLKPKPKVVTRSRRATPLATHRVNPTMMARISTKKDSNIKLHKVNTSAIKLNAKMALIHKVDWNKTKTQSNLHFTLKDKHTKEPLYKSEISIQSKNTSLFKEIESDENGKISTTLPAGSYEITVRKNGYKEVKFTQAILTNKNQNISKTLEPKEVVYDSYFLMGIIGEKIAL